MKKFIILTLAFVLYFNTSLNSGTTNTFWIPKGNLSKPVSMTLPLQSTTDGKTTVLQMINSEELECMSKNIYFEAALESTAGKLAVAQVTMNRVNSSRYPNTVCTVVYQGRHYKSGLPVKHRCQFSWYCDGKLDEPHTGAMWRESSEIAAYVLSTPDLIDITDGATHYHADYISSPRWADPHRKTVEIDTHIFYNKARKDLTKTL